MNEMDNDQDKSDKSISVTRYFHCFQKKKRNISVMNSVFNFNPSD